MFNKKLERKDGICSHGRLISFVILSTCWFLLRASFQSVVFLFLLWHLFLCQQSLLVPWNLIDIPPSNLTFIFVNNFLLLGVPPKMSLYLLGNWVVLKYLNVSYLPPLHVPHGIRILEPRTTWDHLLQTSHYREEKNGDLRLSFIFSNTKWSWPQVCMRLHPSGPIFVLSWDAAVVGGKSMDTWTEHKN